MDSNSDSGSISVGGRFDRIETTLTRIELKLDSKVDNSDFNALAHRVEVMENGETPMARFVMKQFEDVQQRLSDIVLHGSSQAQAANLSLKELEKDVETLRFESKAARAVMTDKQDSSNKSYKAWAIGISVFTAAWPPAFLIISLLH